MADNELRRLNFKEANAVNVLSLSGDEIPTLVPQSKMNEWLKDDSDPYYKIQMIEYPIKANGLIYEESFFESFVNKLTDHPYPGSKNGHSIFWGERQKTDFLLVGGKLEKNGDGTGKVYFKNYIPPTGESGSNETFIKENKSNMVHYSLVTYPRETVEENADGQRIIRVVESIAGERNDAVDFGTGAMKQVTNKAGLVEDVKAENNKGEEMDKAELLKRLNNLMTNGEISLSEVMNAIGQKDKLVNKNHEEAIILMNSLKEAGIEDPVKEINALKDKIDENSKLVKNAKISETFGPSKVENGKESNVVYKYACDKLENVDSENIEKEINSLKEDPIMIALQSQAADPSSDVNYVGVVDEEKKSNASNEQSGGRRTVTL